MRSTGLILCLRPANERRRYFVTQSNDLFGSVKIVLNLPGEQAHCIFGEYSRTNRHLRPRCKCSSLKTESSHNANLVVTGGTTDCRSNDKVGMTTLGFSDMKGPLLRIEIESLYMRWSKIIPGYPGVKFSFLAYIWSSLQSYHNIFILWWRWQHIIRSVEVKLKSYLKTNMAAYDRRVFSKKMDVFQFCLQLNSRQTIA